MYLDKDEIINSSRSTDFLQPVTGIYFLIHQDEVVYVGRSTDVLSRLVAHRATKDFDRFMVISCPFDKLVEVEIYYICKFFPKYNSLIPANSQYGNIESLKTKFNCRAHALKKFIRLNNIQSTKGYYRFTDFDNFSEFLAKNK